MSREAVAQPGKNVVLCFRHVSDACVLWLIHFALVTPPEQGVSGNRRPGGVWLDYPESASASVQDSFGVLGDTEFAPCVDLCDLEPLELS